MVMYGKPVVDDNRATRRSGGTNFIRHGEYMLTPESKLTVCQSATDSAQKLADEGHSVRVVVTDEKIVVSSAKNGNGEIDLIDGNL